VRRQSIKKDEQDIRGSMATFDKQLRSPKTPTRETTWQSAAMAAVVARSPEPKVTPPRSRSARQRHEAKNGDVVARTTRELEQASGEVARALRTERAAAYASTGNFEEALADLSAALALSENGARASIHFRRGEVLAKQERSEEAIQAYSACLAENPSHARAAYRRAACRNPLDARAADDYEAALALDATLDPGAPSPSLQRRPSLRLGVDAYAKQLEETATDAVAADALRRGVEFRKAGQLQEAVEAYTRCLARSPNHFRAHFDRAFAYDALDDLPKAIADYSEAIRLQPTHALAWYNRGICRERQGDAAAALDDFTEAIQGAEASKHYPVADFYHNRAFAKRKLADFAGAIDDYSSALKLDSRHFKAYYNRAFCLDVFPGVGYFHQCDPSSKLHAARPRRLWVGARRPSATTRPRWP